MDSSPADTGPHYSGDIDRVDWAAVDPESYRRDYLDACRPVIVSGAFEHWPARHGWSLTRLRERWGHVEVPVKGKPWLLGDYISAVLASTPAQPAPYLHNLPLSHLPAEVRSDIGAMPACTRPNWLEHPLVRLLSAQTHEELYIGGAGASFPMLHYDGAHTHAFLMQIEGVKEYVAFAPDQGAYMYPRQGRLIRNRSQIDNVEAPDLQRFPDFAKARGMRFELHPGETLFVPSGWWHTARILTPSITVSVNGAQRSNWRSYVQDYPAYYGDGTRWRDVLSSSWLSTVGSLLAILA